MFYDASKKKALEDNLTTKIIFIVVDLHARNFFWLKGFAQTYFIF